MRNSSVCSVEYQSSGDFNQNDLLKHQQLNSEPAHSILPAHIINVKYTDPFIEGQLDIQMMSQTAMNSEIWYWMDDMWLYSFACAFSKSTKCS